MMLLCEYVHGPGVAGTRSCRGFAFGRGAKTSSLVALACPVMQNGPIGPSRVRHSRFRER